MNAVVVLALVIVLLLAAGLAYTIHRNRQLADQLLRSNPDPNYLPLRRISPKMLQRPRTCIQYSEEINQLVQKAEPYLDPLKESCMHALKGGKRIRAIILCEIARATAKRYQNPFADPADAALAVEFLHCASTAVDDLPEFDNDDLRRGEKALWKTTSRGTALMSSIVLVSASFAFVRRQVQAMKIARCKDPEVLGMKMVEIVSRGLSVAAGGQDLDQQGSAQLLPAHVLQAIRDKTGPFFAIAFCMGWCVGGGSSKQLEKMWKLGMCLGLAFQAADDIGDEQEDAQNGRCNLAVSHGTQEARLIMDANLQECMDGLKAYGIKTRLWNEITAMVLKKTLVVD